MSVHAKGDMKGAGWGKGHTVFQWETGVDSSGEDLGTTGTYQSWLLISWEETRLAPLLGGGGVVAMSASPESSLSLPSRKKGQSCPCWLLLSFFPRPLLPAFYTYKEPAAQGKSLADSAPRTK